MCLLIRKNKHNLKNSPSIKKFKRNSTEAYICAIKKSLQNRDESQVPELLMDKHLESRLICSCSDCFVVVFAGLHTSHCHIFCFHSNIIAYTVTMMQLPGKFCILKPGGIFVLIFVYQSHLSLLDKTNLGGKLLRGFFITMKLCQIEVNI